MADWGVKTLIQWRDTGCGTRNACKVQIYTLQELLYPRCELRRTLASATRCAPTTLTAEGTMLSATVTQIGVLEGVSAASGVERLGDHLYVIGDDSAFLYEVDPTTFKVAQRIPLLPVPAGTTGEGIPKAIKPDFECLTPFPTGEKGLALAAIGSGSKAGKRDACVIIHPRAADSCGGANVECTSMTRFFDVLRGDVDVLGTAKLNLEGATLIGDGTLVLMQRGNVSGVNSIVTVDAAALREACLHPEHPLPPYTLAYVDLPQYEGWDAGLSGVVTCRLPGGDECLLFSGSYEATRSEIDDGETLGSIIGVLPTSALRDAPRRARLNPVTAMLRNPDGSVFRGKVEGVCLLQDPVAPVDGAVSTWKAVAVTDPDGGASQYIALTLQYDGSAAAAHS